MLLDASLVLADLQFALPVVLGVLVLIACKQAARTTAADRSDPLSSVGVPTETRRLPSADERGIVRPTAKKRDGCEELIQLLRRRSFPLSLTTSLRPAFLLHSPCSTLSIFL
jgi:hypothetical protein